MSDAALLSLLAAGVDDRAAIDPRTYRNSYGCSLRAEGLSLGACTASEPEPELLALALRTLRPEASIGARYEALRGSLAALLDLPTGTTVAFTPSGTDAVYLAVALASALDERPVASLFAGLAEMGRGTGLAARGVHFTAAPPRPGVRARVGDALAGWDTARTAVVDVPLRDADGAPRCAAAIDEEVAARAHALLREGRRVILHVNAGSKTGLVAPSRGCVDALRRAHPQALTVVVDAAQGRVAPRSLARWLADGAMVSLTASKFYAAPAFAGALLLPPGQLVPAAAAPAGLGDYLCEAALPARWKAFGAGWNRWHNEGLWLRWELGLHALRRYLSVPEASRAAVGGSFAAAVSETLGRSPTVALRGALAGSAEEIVCFGVRGRRGALLDLAALSSLRAALGADGFVLGQAVTLAPGSAALRVSLNAPMVARLAGERDRGRAWLLSRLGHLTERVEGRAADHA